MDVRSTVKPSRGFDRYLDKQLLLRKPRHYNRWVWRRAVKSDTIRRSRDAASASMLRPFVSCFIELMTSCCTEESIDGRPRSFHNVSCIGANCFMNDSM